ncbi:hypothetical protein EDC01DRAFT_632169 [Geopyxis carbonaria]|nr:hypothetical protein EDC01DRAFT_632169 [Geopyxis carbonaria]
MDTLGTPERECNPVLHGISATIHQKSTNTTRRYRNSSASDMDAPQSVGPRTAFFSGQLGFKWSRHSGRCLRGESSALSQERERKKIRHPLAGNAMLSMGQHYCRQAGRQKQPAATEQLHWMETLLRPCAPKAVSLLDLLHKVGELPSLSALAISITFNYISASLVVEVEEASSPVQSKSVLTSITVASNCSSQLLISRCHVT